MMTENTTIHTHVDAYGFRLGGSTRILCCNFFQAFLQPPFMLSFSIPSPPHLEDLPLDTILRNIPSSVAQKLVVSTQKGSYVCCMRWQRTILFPALNPHYLSMEYPGKGDSKQ
ncbi:hypothetical protein CDAR_381391 [Caerostris darwini]|uniref:Uncharacterized protein n=1 Tax=Caerostris darwini TaxID=1538125 RepID=A0AAV4UME9_9ARAC|nr:hypothetical protein CDAR_381391 [Caerostris darwini]